MNITFYKWIVFTIAMIVTLPLPAPMNQAELDELKIIAQELGLSDEEQQAVIQETNLILSEYEKLPPEEQQNYLENLEQKVEREMVKLDEMERNGLLPAPLPEPVFEEPVVSKEEKKEKAITATPEQLAQMRVKLNNIGSTIGNVILKTESAPRVATEPAIEQAWQNLRPSLAEVQSHIKIIVHKDELLTPLLSDEFNVLKGQLDNFYEKITALEKRLVVPDISAFIDTEKKSDTKSFAQFTKAMSELVQFLRYAIEEQQVGWGLKRLIQKYAPEEIKKEEPKKQPQPLSPGTVGTYIPPAPTRGTPSFNRPTPSYPSYGQGVYTQPAAMQEPSAPAIAKKTGASLMPAAKKDIAEKKSAEDKKDIKAPASKITEPEKGKEPKKTKIEDPYKKRTRELEEELKKITDVVESTNLIQKIQALKQQFVTPTRATMTFAVNEIQSKLAEISALFDKPVRLARSFNDTLSARLSKERQKPYREEAQKLLTKEELKIRELHDTLNELADPVLLAQVQTGFTATPQHAQNTQVLVTQAQGLLQQYELMQRHLKGEEKDQREVSVK